MPVQPVHCHPDAFEALRLVADGVESTEGLVRGAIAISLHEYPDTDVDGVEEQLAELGRRVAGRVHSGDPRAILAHTHAVLFDDEGFGRDHDGEYAPEHNYLPHVLETRCGLPVTLSLVYKAVLESVGMRVFGIGAPGHFLSCVQVDEDSTMLVDCFHSGRVLSVDEAIARTRRYAGHQAQAIPLPVVTHREWLQRILRNLSGVFRVQSRHVDRAAMIEMKALL